MLILFSHIDYFTVMKTNMKYCTHFKVDNSKREKEPQNGNIWLEVSQTSRKNSLYYPLFIYVILFNLERIDYQQYQDKMISFPFIQEGPDFTLLKAIAKEKLKLLSAAFYY